MWWNRKSEEEREREDMERVVENYRSNPRNRKVLRGEIPVEEQTPQDRVNFSFFLQAKERLEEDE